MLWRNLASHCLIPGLAVLFSFQMPDAAPAQAAPAQAVEPAGDRPGVIGLIVDPGLLAADGTAAGRLAAAIPSHTLVICPWQRDPACRRISTEGVAADQVRQHVSAQLADIAAGAGGASRPPPSLLDLQDAMSYLYFTVGSALRNFESRAASFAPSDKRVLVRVVSRRDIRWRGADLTHEVPSAACQVAGEGAYGDLLGAQTPPAAASGVDLVLELAGPDGLDRRAESAIAWIGGISGQGGLRYLGQVGIGCGPGTSRAPGFGRTVAGRVCTSEPVSAMTDPLACPAPLVLAQTEPAPGLQDTRDGSPTSSAGPGTGLVSRHMEEQGAAPKSSSVSGQSEDNGTMERSIGPKNTDRQRAEAPPAPPAASAVALFHGSIVAAPLIDPLAGGDTVQWRDSGSAAVVTLRMAGAGEDRRLDLARLPPGHYRIDMVVRAQPGRCGRAPAVSGRIEAWGGRLNPPIGITVSGRALVCPDDAPLVQSVGEMMLR